MTTDDHNNDKKFKDAKELSNSSATRGWGIIVTLDVKRWESLVEKLGILVKDLPVPSGEAKHKFEGRSSEFGQFRCLDVLFYVSLFSMT